MSRLHRCWNCEATGIFNLEVDNKQGSKYRYYACEKDKPEMVGYWEKSGFKYKKLTAKVCCSLILCKECMKDVKEVLAY